MTRRTDSRARWGALRTALLAVGLGASLAALALAFAPRASADGRLLVAGGVAAAADAWPSAAAIVRADVADERTGLLCGGSVVGAYAVLTSADCVSASGIPVDVASLAVLTGRPTLGGADGQRLAIARIHLDPGSGLAILQLVRGTTAPAMRLATTPEDDQLVQVGQAVDVAGWGGADGALQQARVLLGQANPGISTCPGDRGGPVVGSDAGGARIQVGVVITSRDACTPASPATFARVATAGAWISQVVAGTMPVIPPPVIPPPVQATGSPTPGPRNLRPSVRRTYQVTVRRGRTVRLRYQIYDDALETREIILITNPRGRLIKRIVKPLQTFSPDTVYGISWRVPKTALLGRWRYCVEARDAEGLRDRECASFYVRR